MRIEVKEFQVLSKNPMINALMLLMPLKTLRCNTTWKLSCLEINTTASQDYCFILIDLY